MKKTIAPQKFISFLSVLLVSVCFVTSVVGAGLQEWHLALSRSLVCADFILLLRPLRRGESPLPTILAITGSILVAALPLAGLGNLALYVCAGFAGVYMTSRYVGLLSDVKPLFKNDSPLRFLEEYSTCVQFLLACIAALIVTGEEGWLSLIVSALLFAASMITVAGGRIPALSRDKEQTLKDMIRGDLRSSPYVAKDTDDRMNVLYTRVKDYMDKDRPYLDEEFSLSRMASDLFTNKSYLSRVINYYSGRNFKQFVNYYRVRYAVELIKKDQHLSVLELATMSGFRSTVTFNIAFKLNMNDSPGSYCRNAFV